MAETIRVSSASTTSARRRSGPRPRLPHPRHDTPCDETAREPLGPVAGVPLTPPPREEIEILLPTEPHALPRPSRRAVPRTRTERAVLTVLLPGLVLNALALRPGAGLSRSDVLLGGTVLLAGVTLLVLMEVYRRTGR